MIDLLSLAPILLDIFAVPFVGGLGALRILRLWRVARYIPSFSVISNAFNARKEDIITSLLGVVLLSLTLSAFMFHFENAHKEITDSINYAKRLQHAIFPPTDFITTNFPESFILYKPYT